MNIEEVLKRLEDSIKEPFFIGEDYYTGEGYEVPNFFCLDPTTNDCKTLFNYITKLQNNWNELKEHCNTMLSIFEKMNDKDKQEQLDKYVIYDKFLSKMQKLEGNR